MIWSHRYTQAWFVAFIWSLQADSTRSGHASNSDICQDYSSACSSRMKNFLWVIIKEFDMNMIHIWFMIMKVCMAMHMACTNIHALASCKDACTHECAYARWFWTKICTSVQTLLHTHLLQNIYIYIYIYIYMLGSTCTNHEGTYLIRTRIHEHGWAPKYKNGT